MLREAFSQISPFLHWLGDYRPFIHHKGRDVLKLVSSNGFGHLLNVELRFSVAE